MDLVDRVIEFIEEEAHRGKLTESQMARLRGLFATTESSRATTLKMPIHQEITNDQ